MTESKISRRNYLKYAGGIVAVGAVAAAGLGAYQYYGQPRAGGPKGGKLKIGILAPLSGTYSMWGKDQVECATLALEEWKAKGGPAGYDYEVITRDTETKPGPAVTRLKELMDVYKIDFLFGVLSSAVAFAVNESLKGSNLWWTYGAGAEPKMRVKGTIAKNAWCPFHGLEVQARAAAQFYHSQKKDKAYIAYADYVAGQQLQQMFSDEYKRIGGSILASKPFPLGSTDYSSYVTEALNLKPDVFFLVGGGSDLINCVKQASEFKLFDKMDFHIGHGGTVSMGQGSGVDITKNLKMGAYFSWVDDTPGTKEFVKKFMVRFGYPPDYFGASVYTGVQETFTALDKVGKLDYEEMRAFLEGRKFTWTKEEEYWRKEDHQAIGQYLILAGKQPNEMTTQWDYFKIYGKVDEEKAGIVEPVKNMGY
jgi:branched-chain amino acid transport system substrate-binding protein